MDSMDSNQFVTAKLQVSTSWGTQSDFNTMKSYSRQEWSADFGDMVPELSLIMLIVNKHTEHVAANTASDMNVAERGSKSRHMFNPAEPEI